MSTETKYVDAAPAMNNFIVNVKALIERKGLSVTELAKQADLERVTVSRLLNGKGGNCSIATGERIAEALGEVFWKLVKPPRE